MTKFLDEKFSSRPATKAYRDNFDAVFKHDPAQLLPEQCPADATGNPIDCGGCEKHDRETLHEFVCQYKGSATDFCGAGCLCSVCDLRNDSKLHKHMHRG